MYMMVSGDRAELRGLNLEGLRRCGFSDLEVRKSFNYLTISIQGHAKHMLHDFQRIV
jgi:acyl-[acyl carrier protein]--UDP-N-acetylglucosamine O-acyltransferase